MRPVRGARGWLRFASQHEVKAGYNYIGANNIRNGNITLNGPNQSFILSEIEKNNGFLNSQKGMPAINIFTLEISINGDMNWDWSAIPFVLPSYMVR